MARQKTTIPEDTNQKNADEHSGSGRSGGNMGAGKSGRENMGTEKPSDDARMGSQKADAANPETEKRSVDDTDDARGGGSNQNRGKGGPEHDATGGRRARHNDDEDKYDGRGKGKRGQ